MREAIADLWTFHDRGAAVAVTTSGLVGRDGLARLGRGAASQAGQRFPWFAPRLGALLTAHGHHVHHVGERIASFPVEHHPLERPDPRLIRRSAIELAVLAQREGWTFVAIPRPGCGGGGLEWLEVKPLLAPYLDDRFVAVTMD
jgi:hypothetical protein